MNETTFELAEKTIRLSERTYTSAVILAAGSSTRMGPNINKQFLPLCNDPVLAHTLKAYQHCPLIREIVVVAHSIDFKKIKKICEENGIDKLAHVVEGGKTRQESAMLGVRAISKDAQYVAIADGARCLTTPFQIGKVCARAYRYNAASAGHRLSDTIKRTNAKSMTRETVDRSNLWQAQTPQVFHTALYTAALHRAVKDKFAATDDNALIEHLGFRVCMVECGAQNIKITTPDDLALAAAILAYRQTERT